MFFDQKTQNRSLYRFPTSGFERARAGLFERTRSFQMEFFIEIILYDVAAISIKFSPCFVSIHVVFVCLKT